MIRWSHVVIASLGMTGLALAQPPPPPPPSPPSLSPPSAGPAAPQVAAPAPASRNRLGADLAFVLPLGDYAENVDAAFGLFGRLEVGLGPQLFATGRLGFLYNVLEASLPGSDISLTMIPVYGGIRYDLEPTGAGFFFLGEAGLNIIRSSVSFMGDELSETDTKLSLNVGAGFQAGAFSVKGTLFFTPLGGGSDTGESTNWLGLMAALGFDFIAL
jgi:hypothetical protein